MRFDFRRLFCAIFRLIFSLSLLSSITARQQQKRRNDCEQGKVPTVVKVWPDGRPELFCHFPNCPLFSTPSTEFEDAKGKGNLKRTDEKQWKRREDEMEMEKGGRRRKRRGKSKREEDEDGEVQKMHCSDTPSAAVCDLPDEWTVELAEENNGTHISLLMRCCAVANLSEWAAPLKQIVLAPGEQFGGGQVQQNGKMMAFDVIKEIRKNVTAENDVRYILSVFRVLCASAPPKSPADSDFTVARPIFSHLSGVRLASGDTDTTDISVPPTGDASQRGALSRRERPSFALMRKAMQKAKEWRRRPLLQNDLSAPSLNSSAKSVADFDGTRTAQQTPQIQTQISDKDMGDNGTTEETVTADMRTTTTASSNRNIGASTTTAATTMVNTWKWSTISKRLPLNGNATSFDGFLTMPARMMSSITTIENNLNGPNGTMSSSQMQQQSLPTQLRKMGATADATQRNNKHRGRIKYTGLATIRHRIDWPMNSMSDERKEKEEREDSSKMASGKDRSFMAEEKPTNFGTAGGAFILPLKNVQLMDIGRSSSKSEEDELQTVKGEKQQQKMANGNEWASSVGQIGGDIRAQNSAQSSADCATIRTGRSDGCDGSSDGTAAPSELVLSCGLCSCSQCNCLSLPSSCNGPNCPFCPSMCQCPAECGCESSSFSAFNAIGKSENGVEFGESQAVEQQQQQQFYNGQDQGGAYAYNQQFGYGANGGYGAIGGNGLNDAFASLQCFSGEQLVRTARGPVRMDNLRIGDLVLSMDESLLSFSPVLMFLHRKPSESAVFVRIHTELGHHLQLTELHLIWVGCAGRLRLIKARELRPGQCVYALREESREEEEEKVWRGERNGTEKVRQTERRGGGQRRMVLSRIVGVEKVRGRGIYAPLTANGNILVNDILASCHANLAAQTLQQTFFNWWRVLRAFGHKLRSIVCVSGLWQLVDNCWMKVQSPAEQRHAEGEDVPMGVRFVVTVLDALMPDSIL